MRRTLREPEYGGFRDDLGGHVTGMTDGLVLLAAWAQLLLLVVVLLRYVLRSRER
jgi:hypothetical protein